MSFPHFGNSNLGKLPHPKPHCLAAFAQESAEVQGVKAASGVNDQPFGHEDVDCVERYVDTYVGVRINIYLSM